ncbi:hypothetical protein Tco_0828681 [Tanacetum coccineum]
MLANIKLYDGTANPEDHLTRGWFERLLANSINEWVELREAFASKYSVRRACFKEPHEITKIVRKANGLLTAFKERWTVETGFIMGVLEVMKISSFIDSLKCPELAKRFSNKAPVTMDVIMRRVDDFVPSEEAFARTKLPKGETGELHQKSIPSMIQRDDCPYQNNYVGDPWKYDNRSGHMGRDAHTEEGIIRLFTLLPEEITILGSPQSLFLMLSPNSQRKFWLLKPNYA